MNEELEILRRVSDVSKQPQLSSALYCSAGESATVSNRWRSVLTYKGVGGPAVQRIAENIDGNQSNLKLKIDHVEVREFLDIFALLPLKQNGTLTRSQNILRRIPFQ